ncbi:MAG: hypothetical protein JSR36_13600 [Proteobacteria bacterium]|nr:hypothetical protein [Pseudomonadota bacterium]
MTAVPGSTEMTEPLCFAGAVACTRGAGALGLTLAGRDAAGQPLTVAFAAPAPTALPAQLHDACVAPAAAGTYRIRGADGEWLFAAPPAHVHRDVGAAFYRAIPPRPVPLAKRLFWRAVLGLAGSRSGMALLRTLRGSS